MNYILLILLLPLNANLSVRPWGPFWYGQYNQNGWDYAIKRNPNAGLHHLQRLPARTTRGWPLDHSRRAKWGSAQSCALNEYSVIHADQRAWGTAGNTRTHHVDSIWGLSYSDPILWIIAGNLRRHMLTKLRAWITLSIVLNVYNV